MTIIKDIKITSVQPDFLKATASWGTYHAAPGHPSSVIAVNAVLEEGEFSTNRYYTISADDMPTIKGLVLDHINTDPKPDVLYIFMETR